MAMIVISAVGCGSGGGGGNPGGGDVPITGEPVWNAKIGYIAESISSSSSFMAASANKILNIFNIKETLAHESFAVITAPAFQVTSFKAAGAGGTGSIWDYGIKFIYLDWAPLSGATYYKIYFKGKDGTEDKEVWDSRSINPGDPQHATIAYLDISDELSKYVSEPGEYKFQTIAYNNSYSKEYPVVTASIGTKMTSLPTGLNSSTLNELTWTALAGATGYKVGIYKDSLLRDKAGDSGTTLLSDITFDYSTLNLAANNTYFWVVYACSVDSSNKVVEITFTVSSFDKN